MGGYTLTESLYPLCTTAYVITRKAAQFLLDSIQCIRYHIDVEMARAVTRAEHVRYYVFTPNIVTQRDVQSSISPSHRYSVVFGWSPQMMWYCNTTAWKYGSVYTTVLWVLLLVLLMLWAIRKKPFYMYAALLVTAEMILFVAS
jgi:GR25 family glycosyltransferase involved in LPS biosynthesis